MQILRNSRLSERGHVSRTNGGDTMRMRGGKPRIVVHLSLGFALICVSSGESGARAQARPGSEQEFQQLIHSVEGPNLFRAYCASCHGADAKGHGPAAAALKTSVADLTALAKNNGGQFPSKRVRSTITGEEVLASHGSREMPIWGPIFHEIESDVDRGNVRLDNLMKYLESIQSIPSQEERVKKVSASAESLPSGAQLYKQHCAVCHESDLKVDGPAPPPFRVPPDLSTLTRRHDGKFPEAYVVKVLRNGVKMPAHGPAEMPIWGTDFRARDRLDETQVTLRITNLTNYIKSIQKK
jgi:mono/diheme cytochrome c family protein